MGQPSKAAYILYIYYIARRKRERNENSSLYQSKRRALILCSVKTCVYMYACEVFYIGINIFTQNTPLYCSMLAYKYMECDLCT